MHVLSWKSYAHSLMNSQILKTWNDEHVEQKQIKKLAEMFLKVSGYVEPYDCTYW